MSNGKDGVIGFTFEINKIKQFAVLVTWLM